MGDRGSLGWWYYCWSVCLCLVAVCSAKFVYLSFSSLYWFVLSVACFPLKVLSKELSLVEVGSRLGRCSILHIGGCGCVVSGRG